MLYKMQLFHGNKALVHPFINTRTPELLFFSGKENRLFVIHEHKKQVFA